MAGSGPQVARLCGGETPWAPQCWLDPVHALGLPLWGRSPVFIQETQIVAEGTFWPWYGEVLLTKLTRSFTKGLEQAHTQEQGRVEQVVCV